MKRAGEYSLAAQVWTLREYGEVGPRTFRALIVHYGSPAAILEAELDELKAIHGLGDVRSRKICDCFEMLGKAEEFIQSLKEREIGFAVSSNENYPELLLELNDPPPIIFYRGKLPEKNEKTVAIVGTHKATNEGIASAVGLASQLADKSVSIVSGLARGIDASAHIGAIKGDGKTYAVIGSGFDNIYPEENRPLAIEIAHNGGIISEYPPDATISDGRLIARNRLTVGLSQAVIIGEVFGDSSGTLDTARFCHELGKLMFVIIDSNTILDGDKSGIEKVLAMGAIPLTADQSVDIITKSLV
jgi:DNA processing protein